MSAAKERASTLKVRTRTVFIDDLDSETEHSVHCPTTDADLPLASCFSCLRYAGLAMAPDGELLLHCRAAQTSAKAPSPDQARRTREWMQQVPARAWMATHVTCVDVELRLCELAALFARERLRWAPVLDERGSLVGVVSMSDLARGPRVPPPLEGSLEDDDEEDVDAEPGPPFEAEGTPYPPDTLGLIVEDVMTQAPRVLGESASMADAARLFADAKVRRAPVVTATGRVVGVLSSSDLARCLAGA